MSEVDRELQLIRAAKQKGTGATVATYIRLSGPGWLQGAITLGGGSLAGALYLGVIMGYHLMWLQPIAMILGVIMLSAISYVTLSTGQRPFGAINKHISPLLGWGWLIASMMANIVWCLPQFALGTAAVKQNLIPKLNNDQGTYIVANSLLVVASIVVWFYNSGSWGIKLFEIILKIMVGIVVLSFFGVVIAMTAKGALNWGEILSGLIPNVSTLFQPAPSLNEYIEATGSHADWWRTTIANTQKDKIITAFATAVGINMTFLLPYSMLRKGWGKEHRGLAIFDLSIGLIVPFVLATGCVVIAAASQFHGHADDVFAIVAKGKRKEVGAFNKLLDARLTAEFDDYNSRSEEAKTEARTSISDADKRLAAMLAERDNLALANTLEPLVGKRVAQTLFGVGDSHIGDWWRDVAHCLCFVLAVNEFQKTVGRCHANRCRSDSLERLDVVRDCRRYVWIDLGFDRQEVGDVPDRQRRAWLPTGLAGIGHPFVPNQKCQAHRKLVALHLQSSQRTDSLWTRYASWKLVKPIRSVEPAYCKVGCELAETPRAAFRS